MSNDIRNPVKIETLDGKKVIRYFNFNVIGNYLYATCRQKKEKVYNLLIESCNSKNILEIQSGVNELKRIANTALFEIRVNSKITIFVPDIGEVVFIGTNTGIIIK